MMPPLTRRHLLAAAIATGLVAANAGPAAAQAYPSKPIRLVVGFGPGGGNDIIARLVGQKLQESLGQPVVIENKPGAGAMIATEYVAKAEPDGYTLLVGASGAMAITPAVMAKVPYDSVKDFAPISIIGSFPLVLVVNASSSIKSVADLVAAAKADPAKANYASSSMAFQLPSEMLKLKTGMPAERVSYKSSGEMLRGVLAGEVLFTISDTGPATEHVKAGTLRALAITAPKRTADLPAVPTMAEAGVPGLEAVLWSSLFAPAGTPPEIVAKLEAEMRRISRLPDIVEKMKAVGVDAVGSTAAELKGALAADIAQWTAVAKAANVSVAR